MARKSLLAQEDLPEFIGQVIDIFEDFLESHNVCIHNPERDSDPNVDSESAAIIYGIDYGELQDAIEQTLSLWGLIRNDAENHINKGVHK